MTNTHSHQTSARILPVRESNLSSLLAVVVTSSCLTQHGLYLMTDALSIIVRLLSAVFRLVMSIRITCKVHRPLLISPSAGLTNWKQLQHHHLKGQGFFHCSPAAWKSSIRLTAVTDTNALKKWPKGVLSDHAYSWLVESSKTLHKVAPYKPRNELN